jgi:flagellar basal body-associated protein FliL
MTTIKQQNKLLWIILIVMVLVILLGLFIFLKPLYSRESNGISDDKDKVCMNINEFNKLKNNTTRTVIPRRINVIDDSRDRKVLNDPLYPALNRSEFDIHNSVVEQIQKKNLYNTTQEFTDRYRLVGYVTNQESDKKDSGGNVWKLMAKQKDRNQGEFFMIPANNNYDMKIMLNNEMLVGEKLRDIYTIPKQLTFKTPLLNETPYEVSEIPMNDFTNNYQ